MEWEAAENVVFWCDRSQAMTFRSERMDRTKAERGMLLALALCVLLNRGGERFGLLGTEAMVPRHGERQLMRVASLLSADIPVPGLRKRRRRV